jgi:hypothetical protein
LELDTIDNLAQPTTYNLVLMVECSYRMKVVKGLVYTHQTLDDLQIDASTYAVVKVDNVDMVQENLR